MMYCTSLEESESSPEGQPRNLGIRLQLCEVCAGLNIEELWQCPTAGGSSLAEEDDGASGQRILLDKTCVGVRPLRGFDL